jgi:hypothetical protein
MRALFHFRFSLLGTVSAQPFTIDWIAGSLTKRKSSSSEYVERSMPVQPPNKAKAPSLLPNDRNSSCLACAASTVSAVMMHMLAMIFTW